MSSEKFKYEKNGKLFKCYATINKNKIEYIQCYPLYKDDKDLKLRKIEKRYNGYKLI